MLVLKRNFKGIVKIKLSSILELYFGLAAEVGRTLANTNLVVNPLSKLCLDIMWPFIKNSVKDEPV